MVKTMVLTKNEDLRRSWGWLIMAVLILASVSGILNLSYKGPLTITILSFAVIFLAGAAVLSSKINCCK